MTITDLKTEVPTYKYVDDTTIYTVTNDPQSSKLQKAMDTIQSWSENNRMRINAKKTKEMLISFQKLQKDIPPIIVDGQVLERVDCVTLLGVKINNKLT